MLIFFLSGIIIATSLQFVIRLRRLNTLYRNPFFHLRRRLNDTNNFRTIVPMLKNFGLLPQNYIYNNTRTSAIREIMRIRSEYQNLFRIISYFLGRYWVYFNFEDNTTKKKIKIIIEFFFYLYLIKSWGFFVISSYILIKEKNIEEDFVLNYSLFMCIFLTYYILFNTSLIVMLISILNLVWFKNKKINYVRDWIMSYAITTIIIFSFIAIIKFLF